jgi:hypothetical protein
LGPEPGRGAGIVAVIMVLIALGAGIALTELFVAQGYRPAAMGLIAAVVLLVAVSRVRALVQAGIERRPAWGADPAWEPWSEWRAADSRLARVHDEIRSSARSQSYFEHLLWPRLVALARARGVSPESFAKPPGRRFGRGPSTAALARLIAILEASR